MIGQTEFTFKLVESPESLDEVFRLRFQVYCRECNFIRVEDYPDGKESDKYDKYALHFVVEDQYGLIGTARLILDSPLGFPIEEHCAEKLNLDINSLTRNKLAEISRLVISREYRRRRGDGLYYTPDYDSTADFHHLENVRRRVMPIAFGLYREMYQESKHKGITYWYAIMEKSLFQLLCIHGFIFKPIGPEIDFYGPVRPYLGNIEEMEQTVHQRFPNLVRFFVDGLETEYLPKFLR